MKVLHYGSLDASTGGPAMSTYLTLKGLRDNGVDAEIIQFPLTEGGTLRGCDIPMHYASPYREPRFAYAPRLRKEIRALGLYDVYHVQGLWQYPTYALIDEARRAKKPYVVTPRGMLYPHAIAHASSLFKRLSLKIRLLSDLNKAACVHVTCQEEMRHCRDLGVKSPIAVIPNPVDLNVNILPKRDEVFRLGYLGRLSHRKNVEGLIEAFYQLGERAKGAELLIIGGGDADYEQRLKQMVADYNLKNVRFAGFLSGKEKDEALASCSVLAMPSEFENLGNVILEGLVRGIPCIATHGSPWQELETTHCGWWVPYNQEAITNAVGKALECSKEELRLMGANGRQLMRAGYSVDSIGKKMQQLYAWLLGKAEKPDFVFCS